VCVGKVALFGKLWFERRLVGLANVCNVGWGFNIPLRVGEKNKINSLKFALSFQKAKSSVILNLSLSFLVVAVFFSLAPNGFANICSCRLRVSFLPNRNAVVAG